MFITLYDMKKWSIIPGTVKVKAPLQRARVVSEYVYNVTAVDHCRNWGYTTLVITTFNAVSTVYNVTAVDHCHNWRYTTLVTTTFNAVSSNTLKLYHTTRTLYAKVVASFTNTSWILLSNENITFYGI